jgi:azurin
MNMKKTISYLLSFAAAAVLFTGCGGGDGDGAAAPRPAAPAQQPQAAAEGAIVITGNDQMRFDKTEFTVPAGSEVTIEFRNIGRMPKEAMGHNLVVLTKDTNVTTFANAAMRHPQNEYVPPEMQDSVIAATRVLGPGESQTITFTAPTETGDYPFVCSFPGHTPAGMRGIMKVQ